MLPAGVVEKAREISEAHMSDVLTVVHKTPSPGRDEYGDPLPPQTSTTKSKCRLRGISGGESVIAGQLTNTATATVICPLGVDVRSSDELKINGVEYQIRHVLPRTEAHSAHKVILVSRSA